MRGADCPEYGGGDLSLQDLVCIPTGYGSLLDYLEGAGLLGSEHLQYPENLLLAANDIIDQLRAETVIYGEVRAETTGYCAAGMSPPDATDLLCLGFDLANAYHNRESKSGCQPPWVRLNVLLGAKRHKTSEECDAIIRLLTYYLQRGETFPPYVLAGDCLAGETPENPAPKWWKPSRVVGFDLSGNEQKQLLDLNRRLEPLFRYSSPVTIHAGEAVAAESIWEAVYRYGARRIGHGLRLRENERLLGYCVNEGICMEFCPISNRFTNGFVRIADRLAYRMRERSHYPLRYYMKQGLDVNLNTDNRSLHRESTLTAEFLCAAEMVGGLTRWEVLGLVKTGFKNAFLKHAEIDLLLQHVEDRIYAQILNGSYAAYDRD